MEVAELNQLRRNVTRLWNEPGERPTPMIHLSDEDGDREGVGEAFRTIASELGIRHMRLDLSTGLSPNHVEALGKAARNPRLIVITNIEGLPPEERPKLHDMLCADAKRTLPVVVSFGPADEIRKVREGWESLQTMKAAREAMERRYAELGIGDVEDGAPI